MRISDWSSDVCSSDLVVDGAVVDIDAFAVGGIHELVAVLDVTRPRRQRLQEQEFGDGGLYLLSIPGAEMPFALKHQVAAYDDGFAARCLGALLGQLDTAQQGTVALDQGTLGELPLAVVAGP